MIDTKKLISDYSDLIEEHRTWLHPFGKQRLDKWEELLKANPESAICEAATRRLLSKHGVKTEPYEDLSSGGPDFLCFKDGKTFYVENTCISINAATKESGLYPTDSPDIDDTAYQDMTEKFRSEISNKVPQCSKVKAPCIVVIATLHSKASVCCIDELAVEELLTGTTYITGTINTKTGEKVGDTYESARLENSAFIRPQKNSPNWIEHARNPVSAVLLCGFSSNSTNVLGCLHPNPNYIFDRILLPQIKFCRLAKGYQTGQFTVEWI
jgi:hypothetical protein